MTLRRLVDDLVSSDAPAGVVLSSDETRVALEEAGHGDLDPSLVGDALVHYADTAPIAVADALAPTVTTASSVPLDPDLDPVLPFDEAVDGDAVDPDAFDHEPDQAGDGSTQNEHDVAPPDELDVAIDAHPGAGAGDEAFGSGSGDTRPAITTDDDGPDVDEPLHTSGDHEPDPDPFEPVDPLDSFDSAHADVIEPSDTVDESEAGFESDPDLLLDD